MNNLRYYLAWCTLPIMKNGRGAPLPPPDGHKSHQNLLQVRPETWRRLENIFDLKGKIDETILSWMDTHVPFNPLDSSEIDVAEEHFTLPCPEIVDISLDMLKRPDSVARMVPWLDNLPLQTVQSAIHLMFPATFDWGFSLVNDTDNLDKDIFQYFSWSTRDAETLAPSQNGRNLVTVAFQPPWILSSQDIKTFSECRSFPPFRKSGNAYPIMLESQDRLWAKIWDVCVRRRTRWFVLTSYTNWVFGAFSEGWSSAFVTDVYAYDSCNPSIAECLTFWVVSAMRIDRSACVPKVPEPLAHRLLPVPIPAKRANLEFGSPANSDSNWDGKNDDVESSAGVQSNISDTASYESGLTGLMTPMNRESSRRSLRDPVITSWLADAAFTALEPNPPANVYETVGPFLPERPHTRLGDWLV
ncbi:hypothetical protein Hypma_011579 [Hypsizygus marmoreus]|uniref:Uncharacterized protein n=1 Tax=Hypsizygus marmoreus TaxID=39966 RepID=A0A369JPM0_HYPMA|nr:hypothetical protein Hypma_011579 [Hypsizygus marmoreus]